MIMAFSGKPKQCPDCKHVAWHVLKDGTDVNTAEEAYVCMTPGCKCERVADKIPPGKGYKRVNHAWHYTPDHPGYVEAEQHEAEKHVPWWRRY
jgi:hypothetical protein